MEIQSLILCRRLKYDEDTGEYTLFMPCATLQAEHDRYPLKSDMCIFMPLRRPDSTADQITTLLFNLIDEDGRPVGKPRDWQIIGRMPSGDRFNYLGGTVHLEFPAPGLYRLDVVADKDRSASLYSYEIFLEPPET